MVMAWRMAYDPPPPTEVKNEYVPYFSMASAIFVAARSMASSQLMRSHAISSAPRGPERLSG